MEFEAEEQNKTPIIRVGEEIGAEQVKLSPFFFLQIFMDCLPRTMHCTRHSHTSMKEPWCQPLPTG